MNLEYFPSNPTAREMMEMITGNGFYDRSYVGKWIFQVMGMEMGEVKGLFEELRLQIFPETATWGLDYHEQKYGLPVNQNLTIAERRAQVIRFQNMKYPVNPARIEKIVEDYTGMQTRVNDPVKSYIFTVAVNFLNQAAVTVSDIHNIRDLINRMKPSHLSYDLYIHILSAALTNKYQFQLYSFDTHANVSNFGPGIILLNGSKNLDGSWNLDNRFTKGVYLYELLVKCFIANKLSAKNKELKIDLFGMGNRNLSAFQAMDIRCTGKNKDALRLLGADYYLSVKTQENSYLYDLKTEDKFNNVQQARYSSLRAGIYFWHNKNEAEGFQADIWSDVKNKNKLVGIELVKNSMYLLDGKERLDGSRKLNAQIIKEEI